MTNNILNNFNIILFNENNGDGSKLPIRSPKETDTITGFERNPETGYYTRRTKNYDFSRDEKQINDLIENHDNEIEKSKLRLLVDPKLGIHRQIHTPLGNRRETDSGESHLVKFNIDREHPLIKLKKHIQDYFGKYDPSLPKTSPEGLGNVGEITGFRDFLGKPRFAVHMDEFNLTYNQLADESQKTMTFLKEHIKKQTSRENKITSEPKIGGTQTKIDRRIVQAIATGQVGSFKKESVLDAFLNSHKKVSSVLSRMNEFLNDTNSFGDLTDLNKTRELNNYLRGPLAND